MIDRPLRPRSRHIILISHRRALDLIEDTLLRRLSAVDYQIVEEGCEGVVGEVHVGEWLCLVLHAAGQEGDVAVHGGEGGGGGLAVEG